MMAGVGGFVAVHHLLVFVRARRSTEPLTFACMAACLSVYDVACAFLYSAGSPAVGRPWQFVQVASLTAGAVAFVLFAADYTRRPCGRFVAVLGSGVALLVLTAVVGGWDLVFAWEPQSHRAGVPLGLRAAYNEVAEGPVAIGLYSVSLLAFVYVFLAGLRNFREGERRRAGRLLAATAVLFLASVNDLALGLGLIASVYAIEYAFMGLVLLMADSLSADLVRAGQVEEALVRSEERFHLLAEAAFEGIGVTREGRIVDANARLAEMLGYEVTEMVGRPVLDFVAPESAGFVAGILKDERGDLVEHLAVRKDGSVFPIETQGKPLPSMGESVRVAAVRDITERKRTEERIQRLFESLERSNAELESAYDSTLAGWSHALELRDRETKGHSERVVELTVRLARAMGVPSDQLVHVRRGALLHDIGKMGIPDQILQKPAPLSDEEWAVMRQHPELSRQLLSPIAFLSGAIDIPYCHHERWDGSGYPRGLKGKDIPLAARIFSVADAWDALRYERPYRGVWPEDKVAAYLREEAGRRFDPAVVETFLREVV
jgi:PAS domain S-box-containing protein